MILSQIHNVYFIGIGGIGMSALASYFYEQGKKVAGYDLTSTELTDQLIQKGIDIHFVEDINCIPKYITDNKKESIIIYTPAIPDNHKELVYFIKNKYQIFKRSEVLGLITKDKKGIAVAGTHGKTTVSTIIAYLLNYAGINCTAFLGGISNNFNSNLVLSNNSDYVVVEADEFDKSFLTLHPYFEVITAIDPDHLDIYKTFDELKRSFHQFTKQLKPGGKIILKKSLDLSIEKETNVLTYALNSHADFYATKMTLKNGLYTINVHTPKEEIKNLTIGIPGLVNVENAIAAIAIAYLFNVDQKILREALQNFKGVKRRFDIQINTRDTVFIDDYAHHPKELEAFIKSVREIFVGRKITGIFQPHLYSRTSDFADEFAKSLSLLDELIMLDIYPARELPVEGVTSKLIMDKVTIEEKVLYSKKELLKKVENKKFDVLLTLGAGDIDKLVKPLKMNLLKNVS